MDDLLALHLPALIESHRLGTWARVSTANRRSACEHLMQLLSHDYSQTACFAVGALGTLGMKGEIEMSAFLVARISYLLLFPQQHTICVTLLALAKVAMRGDERATTVAQVCLAHQNMVVCSAAATALGEIAAVGNSRVVRSLLELTHDQNGMVRSEIFKALSEVANKGDMAVVRALEGILAEQGPGLLPHALAALAAVAPEGYLRSNVPSSSSAGS